jgi:DNA-binding NarL/FixJ family response regulator
MGKIAVLLADDHAVVREGLRALLAVEEDIEVVGEAQDGREAVELARKTSPDVVVMDLAMPVLNGLEATRQILKKVPTARVLVLTSYGDDESVAQMTQAGATGYLTKQAAANDLSQAIRSVRRGKPFYSPDIANRLRDRDNASLTAGQFAKNNRALTPRETGILQLIAEGFSNREIASELGISIKTVEKHRQAAMNKLDIHQTAGLTRYAISRGMVQRATEAGG